MKTKKQKQKNKNNENMSKANIYMLMLIITLVLEIFVFNFRFLESINYKTLSVTGFNCLDGIERQGMTNVYHVKGSGDKEIELLNINREIKNIYLDIYDARCNDEESNKKGKDWSFQKLAIVICATDEGNKNYFDLPERFVVQGAERTKYIKLETAGNTEKLKLRFNGSDNQNLVINRIELNKRVPFKFNILRVAFVFFLFWLGYTLRKGSSIYDIKFKWNFNQICAVTLLIVTNISISAVICFTNPRFLELSGQYDDLAKAFMNKQVYLETEPPETLVNMENPYDTGERDIVMRDNGTYYKWDHAYYNGKYYVYFGALPALVYYLPSRLLEDKEFYTANGVFINVCFFIVFAFLLIKEIVQRWFKNIPFVVYLMVSQALVFSSGVIFGLRKADVYSMPITMSLGLVMMGMFFWVSAYKSKKPLGRILKLMFGSLFMALVAGCRPQFLMMSFIAIPLFWNDVFKEKKLFTVNSTPETIAFIMPYVLVAGVVMWYNYARFGSVFDFGANYNLTTNDMTARGFRLDRIPLGIFAFFIQPPVVYPKFPFITGVNLSNYYMGKTIMEFMCGGIFATQPLLWILLLLKNTKGVLKDKKIFAFTLCLPIFSVIIAVADAQMAGILCRYYMDYSYPCFIAAAIVAFAVCEKYADKKPAFYIAMLSVMCFIYDFAEMFVLADFGHEYTNPNFYYTITSALTFWM